MICFLICHIETLTNKNFYLYSGGAWDNAKKLAEMDESIGGKGSDVHKSTVIGDTIGDQFKDTAGPSLHVLIKLLATITLVIGPMYIGRVQS